MTAIKAAALAAATALVLSGCATVVSGGTDHVRIDIEPPGQKFQVYQGGASAIADRLAMAPDDMFVAVVDCKT